MKKPYKLQSTAEPYLWILPSVILMAIFIVIPIGFVFRMAFSQITKAGLIKGFYASRISRRCWQVPNLPWF